MFKDLPISNVWLITYILCLEEENLEPLVQRRNRCPKTRLLRVLIGESTIHSHQKKLRG